jgi:hypothetical protein
MCMTSHYHVVSFCFSRFWGSFDTLRDLARAVHNHYLNVRVFLSCSNTLFITHMQPTTCLSFRAIMDLAQRFEWVACEKNISVTELDLNRKYRILRAKRLTTIFVPLWCSLSGAKGHPRPKYSCLGDIMTSLRTPLFSRLIPMLCSCILSTRAYA